MVQQLKRMALNTLNFFFESKPRVVLFLVLVMLPLAFLAKLIDGNHPSSFTVMITDMSEQSGGSGSIILNSRDRSIVLTNGHVCDVLNKQGGLVKKEDGSKYMVTGYKKSQLHDLCAITVAADLGTSVKLAEESPSLYSEATITGHPALLPNIINNGSFGERKIIQVFTGIKKCTEKNVKTEEDALYCMFLGGIPVVTSYESVVVSAMIMGGSSGSAVLNKKGELSGVVFAGQGKGLSYAFIVPFEYVSLFIREELTNDMTLTKVPLENSEDEESVNMLEKKRKMSQECKKNNQKIKNLCEILGQDLDIIK